MLFPFLWECFSFLFISFYFISLLFPFSVGISFFLYFFSLYFSVFFTLYLSFSFLLSLFVLFNLGGSFVLVRVKQAMGFYRVFIIKIRGGENLYSGECNYEK